LKKTKTLVELSFIVFAGVDAPPGFVRVQNDSLEICGLLFLCRSSFSFKDLNRSHNENGFIFCLPLKRKEKEKKTF